ncbi:MAG: tRNA 2-thiouridine(34) synthase MnmA [Candidatus Cloacimonetes bacterium HGW-Cloacimonetes-1]|jgi:tRNA-specific 2-thiouridylase|nr:MAG: tRNA 2-thiouridine(34) synthase MnmA [Candidatus Cloacimonetes bacterium HGW-Cloacimonetes-1]
MNNIAIGMSGGVDSTMAALILKEQGYNVIGLTMAIWDDTIPLTESSKSGCFGPGESEDIAAAVSACEKLSIEHHVISLKDEFRTNVLDYFCSTYTSGKTPNPCVMCNQRLKFGFLPQRAREMGLQFEKFATGHYVRVRYDESSRRWQLLRAIDHFKDQSYFLTFLSQAQLAQASFPMGEFLKEQTKALAIQYGFEELATKQESQDFLETDDYSILFEKGTFAAGKIINIDGTEIGTHQGLIHYTIGQRKNLGIPGQTEPYYVLEINAKTNTIVVGPKQYLYTHDLEAHSMNWISIETPVADFTASAKIRLGSDPSPCTVRIIDQSAVSVHFDEPQLSITPGQVVVIYNGDIVLGGGIIR